MMQKLITKRWFWINFQFLLIIVLNVIGHIQAGNSFNQIFHKLGAMFWMLVVTIIGFPSGIFFFFIKELRDLPILPQITAAIYYPLFLFLVWYITKQKRNWRLIAIGLIIFMVLSFIGCSKVIEIPLQIT